ncbi:MAG: leucine-rich repeat protein [Lachnospiraceae bacterium]|nr:leucine-rich repeat protein [Lachnospiraceae bacterium]
MQAKRWLAAFLSAALVLTSGAFSVPANAEPADFSDAAVYEEESGDISLITEYPDGDEEGAVIDGTDDYDMEETGIGEEDPDLTGFAEDPDETGFDTEEAGPEEITEEELPAEEITEEELPVEEITEEELLTEEIDDTADELSAIQEPTVPSAFLEVISGGENDGTLKVKDDATESQLASTIVKIPKEAKIIPAGIFNGTGTLSKVTTIYIEGDDDNPSALTGIADSAFENGAVQEIIYKGKKTLPEGVTAVGTAVFKGSALKVLNLGNAVLSVGEEAFANSKIAQFTSTGVTGVGMSAFSSCSFLTFIRIEKVNSIGAYAFKNCTSLNGFELGSTLSQVGKEAFYNCAFTSLDLSKFASGVTLSEGVFGNNTKLETLTALPSGITEIPESAFAGCARLNHINLESTTLTTIGQNAFKDCASLGSVYFHPSVKAFRAGAFDGCSGLTDIYIQNKDTTAGDFTIAESAFPLKSGVTMHGYGGKVETYARERKYKYSSYYQYSVTAVLTDQQKEQIEVKLSKDKATPGEPVRVTVKQKNGYVLKKIRVTGKDQPEIPELESISQDGEMVFTFAMIGTTAKVEFETAQKGKEISGALTYAFEAVNGDSPLKEEAPDTWTFTKAGSASKVVISDGAGTTGSWFWNYQSSNPTIVAISASGTLRAADTGSATITATLRSNSSKKVSFTILVGEAAVIAGIDLELDIPSDLGVVEYEFLKDENGDWINGVNESGDPNGVPVVRIEKSMVAGGSKSFEAGIRAHEEGSETQNLMVKSSWSSVDSKIAKLRLSSSEDNKNTVTIGKGKTGETMVTVSVKNKNETSASEPNRKRFIVRIVDGTPRLSKTAYTVNAQSTIGKKLPIVPVYDYGIKDHELHLAYRTTITNPDKTKTYHYDKFCDELAIIYNEENGNYYIRKVRPGEKPKVTTYSAKNKNQLYVTGTFAGGDSTFQIPLTELKVTYTVPNPKIKTTGKINLFYSKFAKASGKVTLTHDLKDDTVEKMVLVSEENEKKYQKDHVMATKDTTPDDFRNNFEIAEGKNNQTFLITRTEKPIAKDKNKKPIVKGWVYIYFEGFESPAKKEIKIETEEKKPEYVLLDVNKKSSAVANSYGEDQIYALKLYDKKTKKKVQIIPEGTTAEYTSATTTGAFTTPVVSPTEYEPDETTVKTPGTITITMNGNPMPGTNKAAISVKFPEWSKPITYTYKVKTDMKLPVVKFKSSMILNSKYPNQYAWYAPTIGSPDAKVSKYEGAEVSSFPKAEGSEAAASAILGSLRQKEGKIMVKLPSADVPAGTYKFKVVPFVTVGEGTSEIECKETTLSVKVKDDAPSIKLKSSKYTMNKFYPGVEDVANKFTISNQSSGVYECTEFNTGDMQITPTGTTKKDFDSFAELSFDQPTKSVHVVLKDAATHMGDGSYTYLVSGVKVVVTVEDPETGSDTVCEETLKSFKITVKLHAKTPTVKLEEAKGTIDPVRDASKTTYKLKISNLKADVRNLKLWEEKGYGKYYSTSEDYNDKDARYSEHYKVEPGEKTNTAVVTMDDYATKPVKDAKTYKMTMVTTLGATATYVHEVETAFTIKPKQSVPAVKTNKSSASLYAGQENRVIRVKVTPKKKNSARIREVNLAANTSKALLRAYRVVDANEDGHGDFTITDTETGEGYFEIELTNPSAIKLGQKYTLNLVTQYVGQDAEGVGNKLKLDVTVNK